MYYIDAIDTFLIQNSEFKQEDELTKANLIVEQLDNSIEWLAFEISRQTDYQEKSILQKEKTAAEWERARLIKEINKVK